MNGLFTWWLSTTTTTSANGIAGDATNLTDNAVGDTTTGIGCPPSSSYYNLALLDIGTSPVDTLNGLLVRFAHGTAATAYNSTDGTTWNNIGVATSGSLFSFAASSARYWLFSLQSDGTFDSAFSSQENSAVITDLRWQTTNGGVPGNYVQPTVIVTPTPDFSITPASQSTAVQNGAGTVSLIPDLTINAINGFAGIVALAVTGQPSGLTATLSAANVAAGGSVNLSLSAAGCTPGAYALTITGTSGSLSHTQTVSVTVSAADSGAAPPAVPAAITVVRSGLNLVISGN